jgi:hypothetical protein
MAEGNKVHVDIYYSFNIYVYRPRDLWLAYGISAAATFLCMGIGVYSMWQNGACYQTVFSTFLRVTKDGNLLRLIDPADSGAEPLPKDLAKASVVLATSSTGKRGFSISQRAITFDSVNGFLGQ